MKSTLLIIIGLFLSHMGTAQFGLAVRYQSNNAPGWENEFIGSPEIESNGLEYALNYWFRLKNYRVEFLPEITYANSSNTFPFETSIVPVLTGYNRTSIGLGLNTQIYPLDFEGDCDCPTFSKDGTLISKGFHFIVNTGLIRHNVETSIDDPSTDPALSFDVESYTFRGGIGVGLDIGLTELITLSPHILVSRNFGVNAINFTDFTPADTISSSSLNQLNIGLRLIFRPDYQKPNFGYR